MKDTILGEIYEAFDPLELKRFNKYMRYSEWNESPTLIRCHEFYAHKIKKIGSIDFDKFELFQYIYPGEKYTDSKLRFTQNRVLRAIKQFVINDAFEQENLFTTKIWMDFLIDKKLRKNLQYHIKEDTQIANSDYRNLHNYFLSQEESHIAFQYSKEKEKQYQTIRNVIDHAQLFSDLVFIRNYCSLITFSQTYKTIPVDLPIEKLQEIRNRTDIEKHVELRVYLGLVDLLLKNDRTSYLYYKKCLFESYSAWDDSEKVNLSAYLINYTSNQINSGKTEYIDEQYDLYEVFDKQKLFYIKNFINHGRINNVVFIYLRKKEFEKAEEFVQRYIVLLNEDMKDTCKHFNLARIFFEKAKHKECLRELLQVDFSRDTAYSLNSKVILIKTYFELKEADALFSLFASFREFIKKNKVLSDSFKVNCLEFIKTISKIYGATPQKLRTTLNAIQETPMIEKNWVLEKITSQLDNKEIS